MPNISLAAALGNRMDHLITRQELTSSNIANASTPGYLRQDISFKKLTERHTQRQGLAITHGKHIPSANDTPAGTIFVDDTHIRHDGNSVKMDEEIFKLNQVQLDYGLVTQLYQKQKQLQQLAVRDNN